MTIRPKVLLLSLVVLVALAAGSVAAVLLTSGKATPAATAPPATFVVHGTFTVSCTTGCSGYSDITSGAQVEVLNQHNDVLAVGTLTSATSTGSGSTYGIGYSYVFTIPNVPRGQGLYGVHVGNANRGVIWKSESEAATTGFQLTIGGS